MYPLIVASKQMFRTRAGAEPHMPPCPRPNPPLRNALVEPHGPPRSCPRTAGIAAHGSSATRPCTGSRFCSTRPSASPAPASASASTASSASFPGLGDVLAGLLSLVIPLAAWIRGVPYVTLVRMAANLGIGVLVGSIPIFGDVFDIAWKANRRNYRLLQRHLGEPRRHTWRDWAFCCCCWPRSRAGLCHSRGAGGLVFGLARHRH